MYLAWSEYAYDSTTESWSYALKYLAGNNVSWQTPPVTLMSDSTTIDQPQLAVDRGGRVGLVYRYLDTNYNAFIYYRECTAPDCSQLQNWSAVSVLPTVSGSSWVEFPHLAFDTGRNVHVSWTSFSSTSIWEIYHATRALSAAPWGNPDFLGTSDFVLEAPAPNTMVAAGTPNNVYVAWNRYLLDANGYVTGLELQYNHGDGQGWSGATTLPSEGSLLSWAGENWGMLGVDKNNVLQMVWNGAGGEVWYASKLQIGVDIGRCRLTEYYDTPQGNFRVYYTRTYPNGGIIFEEDCRLWPPARQLGVAPNLNDPLPLDSISGYPRFAVILGEGLEGAYAKYANLSYPVTQVPKDSSSGRYHVYVSSDPIWTDIPLIGGIMPIKANITVPDHMFITRGTFYTASESVSIDWLRTQGAHELFHAVQWTFIPNAGVTWAFTEDLRWWMESTAVWAEPKVYSQEGWYPMALDQLLGAPYRSLVNRPWGDAGRSYGTFIFPTYLEQKAANSENIILQTWQQYNGGSMLATINQVLAGYGNKSIATEFPEFAWNNYFLNAGTYDRNVATYKVIDNPTGPLSQEKEWQLFRHWLTDNDRKTQSDTTTGVFVEFVGKNSTYPIDGPIANNPYLVEPMGAVYTEFFTTTLPASRAADLTITFSLRAPAGSATPKVSVLPVANFAATPHPGNNFVQPTIQWQGTYTLYTYVQTIQNFHNLNRVAVIISNVDTTNNQISFSYHAEVALR
jgi:hypothetical protein